MWTSKNTNRPLSLRRLVSHPGEIHSASPEPLSVACIVTQGLFEKKIDWILKLERLAAEQDQAILEKQLHALVAQNAPIN